MYFKEVVEILGKFFCGHCCQIETLLHVSGSQLNSVTGRLEFQLWVWCAVWVSHLHSLQVSMQLKNLSIQAFSFTVWVYPYCSLIRLAIIVLRYHYESIDRKYNLNLSVRFLDIMPMKTSVISCFVLITYNFHEYQQGEKYSS